MKRWELWAMPFLARKIENPTWELIVKAIRIKRFYSTIFGLILVSNLILNIRGWALADSVLFQLSYIVSIGVNAWGIYWLIDWVKQPVMHLGPDEEDEE